LDYRKIRFWFQRLATDLHGLRIKAIFCFDGKPCPNKQREAAGRAERRQAAFMEFQRTGEQKALKASFTQSWGLTRACIEALDEIGVEYVVAPREADSQMAYMYHNGEAEYIYADDADLSVMGCKLIRHFNLYQGTATLYDPEKLDDTDRCADPLLQLAFQHGWCQTMQIFSCYVGNDYSNISDVGAVGAIKRILQHGVDVVEHTAALVLIERVQHISLDFGQCVLLLFQQPVCILLQMIRVFDT
jgi:hypothetical protein